MKQIVKNMLLVFGALFIISCEDDPVTDPPIVIIDTSLANFNNIIVSEGSISSFTTFSAADLYRGVAVVDSNRLKDVNLVTNFSISDTTYYFASGDIFNNLDIRIPGYSTRFRLIYSNVSQSIFDTMTSIPATDTLNSADFTLEGTQSFAQPLNNHPVYGFYLKGKYESGLIPHRVFGMMFIDSSYVQGNNFKLKFDIKLNRGGLNKFEKQ